MDAIGQLRNIRYESRSLEAADTVLNADTRLPPALRIEARYEDAASTLMSFVDKFDGRILFTAESAGRRRERIRLPSRPGSRCDPSGPAGRSSRTAARASRLHRRRSRTACCSLVPVSH
ncbi:MAG: hypothetical protein U5K38_05445 [Woeseiaceae bacterium]|nr:hypothetical protein [Woeseiaceae bacterium]